MCDSTPKRRNAELPRSRLAQMQLPVLQKHLDMAQRLLR